jgi:hypothetical protein
MSSYLIKFVTGYKVYWRFCKFFCAVEAYGNRLVTFALSGGEWVNLKPSGLTPPSSPPGADWLSPITYFDVLRWTDLLILPGIKPRYLGRTDRSSVIPTNVRDCQYDKVARGWWQSVVAT